MTPVSENAVSIYRLGNSLTPQEGPASLSGVLNFAIDNAFDLNSLNLVSPGQTFSMVQTVYLDSSSTDQAVLVMVGISGQIIRVKGRTQGYYPVTCPNLWDLKISCTDALAVVPFALLNYQVAPGSWVTQ